MITLGFGPLMLHHLPAAGLREVVDRKIHGLQIQFSSESAPILNVRSLIVED